MRGISWYYLNRCWSFSVNFKLDFDIGKIALATILRETFETSHKESIDGEKD